MTRTENALILLAGSGSRLSPLTDKTHKALIDINGKSILERQIETLSRVGIKIFHLVVGYRSTDIINFTKKFSRLGEFHFYENKLFAGTNNAFSLMLACDGLKEDMILLDGDLIFTEELLFALVEKKASAFVAETTKDGIDDESMKILFNDRLEITKLGKHIPTSEAGGEYIGLCHLQSLWVERLKEFLTKKMGDKINHGLYYEDTINALIHTDQTLPPLFVVPTNGHSWVEIDTAQDLETARVVFSSKNKKVYFP